MERLWQIILQHGIRNSRHAPPQKEAVMDVMEAFFDCLDQEKHPAVAAVLGHYFFAYIHPHMDGNGRICWRIPNAVTSHVRRYPGEELY